jgi:hypothetical protein
LYTVFYFNFTFISLCTIAANNKSKTAMLKPTKQRSLTFLSLSGAQKDAAVRCFSAIQGPTNDDTNRITSYFDRDMTATTRKFILGSCAAILFLENRIFKVLNSPSLLTVGRNNCQTITGLFGDRILHPKPDQYLW